MLIKKYIWLIIAAYCIPRTALSQATANYTQYHLEVVHAEELIAAEKYAEALLVFENLFHSYPYVFVKDYKIAAQLTMLLKDEKKAMELIKQGISDGWALREITRDPFFKPLQQNPDWASLVIQNDSLYRKYSLRLNQALKAEMKSMFQKDQKLAFRYYLRIGPKAKERYAIRKFAPNSEQEIKRLDALISAYGYPGDKIIGNSYWASTILSHHNSIAPDYQKRDTLYPGLRPKLMVAIQNGELAPWDFSIIEDWYVVTKSNQQKSAFGYFTNLAQEEVPLSEALRKSIGLCTISTRNKLVDIQKKTGMNLYLDGASWVEGKINLTKSKN